jgi:hypothetical protein
MGGLYDDPLKESKRVLKFSERLKAIGNSIVEVLRLPQQTVAINTETGYFKFKTQESLSV